MACRFTETDLWDEDWFIELGSEYQHLWNYIKDKCNHAGIWKPNKSGFEMRAKTKVNLDSFFLKVNGDKERILKLRDGNWFLTGFIKFQWFNKKESFDLALSNRLHFSIHNELLKYSVPFGKIRGLREVLQTSKDKVKERDQEEKSEKERASEDWRKWPTAENCGALTGLDIDLTIEFIQRLKQQLLTKEQVNEFWQAFALLSFTGKKFYENREDAIQHFRNWLKNQDGNKSQTGIGGNNGKLGTSEARIKTANHWGRGTVEKLRSGNSGGEG